MVAVPLLIVAATLGYSMVDPNGKQIVFSFLPGTSSTRTSSPNTSSNTTTRWIFGYGVVLGMCLSSALSYEVRRRRLWERVRLTLFSWVQESSMLVLGKYRKPTSLDTIPGDDMTGTSSISTTSCGVRKEIVSPEWCLTSTMNVTILTLYPGSELIPQPSPGVEFYYIIKGDGIYLDGNMEEDMLPMVLGPGACFVVDPGSVRGFQVTGRADLILLRASDAPSTNEQDVTTRREEGSSTTTVDVLHAGLQKVEELVLKYGRIHAPVVEGPVDMADV